MTWILSFSRTPSFPSCIRRSCILTICLLLLGSGQGYADAQNASLPGEEPPEFSARVKWRFGGKDVRAQLFVKDDRYRIEFLSGMRTKLGYAGVVIVRLNEQKVWYVISQRRMVISVPLTEEYVIPFSVRLQGEVSRTLIGESIAGSRPADLYEVVVNRSDREETFFEWVDQEHNVLVKILSKDTDWSVEYEHVVYSTQPDYFFEPPLGYQTIEAQDPQFKSE